MVAIVIYQQKYKLMHIPIIHIVMVSNFIDSATFVIALIFIKSSLTRLLNTPDVLFF
jgi:hypothetical protein